MRRPPFFLLVLCGVAFAATASADDDMAGLGKVGFPITCTGAAQDRFTQGLVLLHHMAYDQAEDRFRASAAADPTCAMAIWGVAMTQFQPTWHGGQSDAALAIGLEAVERLSRIAAPTPREAAYITAVTAFYAKAAEPYPERLRAWAADQQTLALDYPEDVDAGAFAALAMLATAAPGDPGFPTRTKAGAMLEALHRKAPDHPAPFHYAIHAYDHPALADRAAEFAEGYDKMAPDVPHALHMPSHIFVRLGKWAEVEARNRRSAAAALDQPMAGALVSWHYAHAQDYLVYALLQQGRTEAAAAEVAALLGQARIEDDFGSAYALAAAPARVALESGDWAATAALVPAAHAAISWDRFPQAVAITWYAKGLGAVMSNDPAAAQVAQTRLAALRKVMADRGLDDWARLTDAQLGAIKAWATFNEVDRDAGLSLMQAAAETEDAVGKAPVTPGHVLPARELLGDMLAAMQRAEEATDTYKAALAVSPNRARSLAGLGRFD
ncbi:hypothetical protein FNJ84_18505 [Paracoccus sp. M683]|uniref:hypothetical protein n=1 Tax=Paracoccus sp. M683 TaxID=2594268 RepID=UPI00117E61F1|nr:hypothetical protein [Paracoccus sp. M683]TRW94854.1 hypothetical protein FNJ84_18505 [Paracoccus sp. M683]